MSDDAQGDGWWIASDGKWYPPDATPALWCGGPPPLSERSMFTVALVPAVTGWIVLGFMLLLSGFSGEDTNCTSHRGDAYQSCLRNSDLTALNVQGAVMGMAVAASVIVFVGVARERVSGAHDPKRTRAMAASFLLLSASVLGWVLGPRGLWAPERPFPYEPIATSQANSILLVGGVIGLLLGALISTAMSFLK